MLRYSVLLALLLSLVCSQLPAQPVEQAKRHFDAGMAAVQAATSATDYGAAIKEFEQAARLLPTWPDVFLNLGLLEEAVGRYGEAAQSLRRYVKLAPQAVDAELRRQMNDLEYRAIKDGRVLPDIDALMSDGESPLGKAIIRRDLPAVELLLAKGANVNAPMDQYGNSPLLFALDRENRLMIDLLLSRGADVNAKDSRGTPILQKISDRESLELLIEQGADLDVQDEFGQTLLSEAFRKDDLELAEYLHSKGAGLDIPDKFGNTPLALAAGEAEDRKLQDREKALKKLRFLLDRGANPNVRYYGDPLVLHLVQKGQVDLVQMLIAAGADLSVSDDKGMTPLRYAVLFKNNQMVETLLSGGADLEVRSHAGESVLHTASRLGMTSMVEFLVKNGAQLEAKDSNGNTPLALALIENKKETATLLLAKGASTKDLNLEARGMHGRTALHMATLDEDAAAVEQLLNRGAEVNARDEFGLTPLHLAANVGSRKSRFVAELLIAKGADLNAKGNLGHTPIRLALGYFHLAMADYLHSAGAVITDQERAVFLSPDPNVRGEQGKTWLYQAVVDDELEAAERLIKLGADVNAKTSLDTTPLAAAIWSKSEKMVDLLLAHGANPRCTVFESQPLLHMVQDSAILDRLLKAGADIEARNSMGRTALHFAVSIGRKEQVELLVAKGAKLEANSPDGTPLHIAVSSGRTEMVALLLQLGAKPQALDEKRRTPLDLARAQGFKEIEELLLNKGAK